MARLISSEDDKAGGRLMLSAASPILTTNGVIRTTRRAAVGEERQSPTSRSDFGCACEDGAREGHYFAGTRGASRPPG